MSGTIQVVYINLTHSVVYYSCTTVALQLHYVNFIMISTVLNIKLEFVKRSKSQNN